MDKNEIGLPQIHIPEGKEMGVYSNLCISMHSYSEFILDFARILPGQEYPKLAERIILSPDNAKRLAMMLTNNIQQYEKEHGEIELPEGRSNAVPNNIKGMA